MRASNSAIGTYLVFQPVRFTVPLLSPVERWALTPPFHLFRSTVYSLQSTVYSEDSITTAYCLPLTTYCLPKTVVYFLLHLLSNCRRQQFAFPLGSTVLFAVRTFLPVPNIRQVRNDKTALIRYRAQSYKELCSLKIK